MVPAWNDTSAKLSRFHVARDVRCPFLAMAVGSKATVDWRSMRLSRSMTNEFYCMNLSPKLTTDGFCTPGYICNDTENISTLVAIVFMRLKHVD